MPANAGIGDIVTIGDGATINSIVLQASDIDAGTLSSAFAAGADGDALTVSASITDPSGNSSAVASDSASFDISATAAPIVMIVEDANDDGLISTAELSGDIDVLITLPADAVAGDTLSVDDGESLSTLLLSVAEIGAGSVGTTLGAGTDGELLSVSATITDAAGNASPGASDTASYDLAAPSAPFIVITEDVDDNGLIGNPELLDDIGIRVDLPDNSVAGDTLAISDGSTTQTIVLSTADIASGSVAGSVAAGEHGSVLAVSALLTDAAGNQSDTASDSASYDLLAPALVALTIVEDSNDDGLVSIAEANGPTDLSVELFGDVVAGDIVELSDGTTVNSRVLTPADINNGFIISSVAAPASGSVIALSATVTDAAGNTSTAVSDTARYDLVSPDVPVIVITEDSSNDGLISAAELNGAIDVVVTLPSNASAGDTLTISDASSTDTIVLSQADISAGSVASTFAAGADGDALTVTAIVTDPSGNASAAVSDSADYDVTPPSAPSVEIAEDSNNDALISIAEQVGDIDILVTLPTDAVAGDTLSVSNGTTTNTLVLTDADMTQRSVSTTFVAAGDAQQLLVTASISDAAGNPSAAATDVARHDLKAPSAPIVMIAEDVNNDGLIGSAERLGELDITVALPNDALAGDTLQISNGSDITTQLLTAADIASGAFDSSFAAGPDDTVVGVSAQVIDAAGNRSLPASDSARYDLTAPAAPLLSIIDDSDDNGLVSIAEAIGDTDVLVGLPVDAVAGDTVNISDGTSTSSLVLSADDIASGNVEFSFSAPIDGGTITLEADITDLAGNRSDAASDSASYDLSAPDVPVIVLVEDSSDDGLISASELNGQLDVAVTLPADAQPGDIISISDGNATNSVTLNAADITAGSIVTSFAAGADGDSVTVSASVTDLSGNTSVSASDNALYDTTAPDAATLVITEDADDNALIGLAERVGDVDVIVTLPANANVGDTLTVDDGSDSQSFVLSADDISQATVSVAFSAGSDGQSVLISASVTDPAGNQSAITTDSADYDLTAPTTPIIAIVEDTDDNSLIGAAELDGPLDVSIALPADAAVGDTLEISDGSASTTLTLSPADIDAGEIAASFAAGADGATVAVTAIITDGAGNASPSAADAAVYDFTAPASALISIVDDIDNNGLISTAEAQPDSTVQVTLPVDAAIGDTLEITDGTTTQLTVISAADIDSGSVSTSFAAAVDGQSLNVSVIVTDRAGNRSSAASDSARYDLGAPDTPVIVLSEDSSDDGLISDSELDGQVDVTVVLPASALPGDQLSISANSATNSIVLSAADIDAGSVSSAFAAVNDGDSLTVTAILFDPAGNASGSATDSADVDISAPSAVQVSIAEDANNDGLIGTAELAGDIDVSVSLPPDAEAGDTLSIDDEITFIERVLSAADISAGRVSTSFGAGSHSQQLQVNAVITDRAGNPSVSASDSARYDLVAPLMPEILIVEDIDNNGLIGLAEQLGDIDFTVALPAGSEAGDTLDIRDGVSVQSIVLSADDIAAGRVSGSFAAASDGDTLAVSAMLTDAAGNISAAGSDTATHDLLAPSLLAVAIDDDANTDGLISISEFSDQANVTITLNADALAGDLLTVSNALETNTLVLGSADIAAGQLSTRFTAAASGQLLEVTALLTDAAGNASPIRSAAVRYDLSSPDVPVVVIGEDSGNDGFINTSELDGDIEIQITLPGNAQAGDTLTFSDGSQVSTVVLVDTDIVAGHVNTTLPAAADGQTLTVTASVTDSSGNASPLATDSALFDITAPTAPQVIIAEDSNDDGLISLAEQSGDINISVTLPADAEAGDRIDVDNGTTSNSIVLSAADIATGVVVTQFSAGTDADVLLVSASLSDAAGNQSALATDTATLDLTSPATPEVIIAEDTGNDGLISYPELVGSIDVVVILPANAMAGDTLTVSDGVGVSAVTLTAADITDGQLSAQFDVGDLSLPLTVSASLADPVGNSSEAASDSALYNLDSDTDADGIIDRLEAVTDSDADGVADYLDTDSDNDGIADGRESQSTFSPLGSDTDNDGIDDAIDVDATGGGDQNANGIDDSLEPADSDNDGIADYLDSDSDNDGIDDQREGDIDTDNDGTPNYLDSDSDNDGISDLLEQAIDTDGDALADYLDGDSDGDGIDDAIEGTLDSDADGLPNFIDTDADGDGIDDSLESDADSDADGSPNYIDADSDNDGIADAIEGALDSDGDGLADSIDVDANNDGIDDSTLGSGDLDGDGIADYLDSDIDGDGLPNSAEILPAPLDDIDADGLPNYADTDSDGDTIADIIEAGNSATALDSDGDGLADFIDSDSDNDGIDDADEHRSSAMLLGADADGDGIDDALDVDSSNGSDLNGNGIDDGAEPLDTDGDGIADYLDTDSDNDGIVDRLETRIDSDGDGMSDAIDSDSDNDGISDALEGSVSPPLTGNDADSDGIDDALDVDISSGDDANNNGIDDRFEPADSDADGIADYLDSDADGDGIPDFLEGIADTDSDGTADYLDIDSDGDGIEDRAEASTLPPLSGIDSDNDGIDDSLDVDNAGGADDNGDGISDRFEPIDSDADGMPDHLDLDADGDSISDSIESLIDSDGDGTPNYLDSDSDNDGIGDADEAPLDGNGNAQRNFTDTDSDDDGIPDLIEGNIDSDADGVPDFLDIDSDNDGISDAQEDAALPTLAGIDSDADGIDDAIDVDQTGRSDANGNGIDDAFEPTDSDGDGIADYLDSDSDADGIADLLETSGDSDGDGVADYIDVDSDNDGIPDAQETALDSDGDGTPNYLDSDSDNDGIIDRLEQAIDSDADNTPDYLDGDSDNDGIADSIEQGASVALLQIDSDGDGIDDAIDVDQSAGDDVNSNGIDDAFEAIDSDGDGVADYLDTDSDNDGIADIIERDQDSDGDGIADYLDLDSDGDAIDDRTEGRIAAVPSSADADGDGIPDAIDSDLSGGPDANGNGIDDNFEPVDADGDGIADYLDRDSDGDGIVDLLESSVDSDADGIADYLDVDADNDGLADGLEDTASPLLLGIDSDADGIDDALDVDVSGGEDRNSNGIDDVFEPADADGDGIANHLDSDSDGDGVEDALEAGGDPLNPLDSDADGVPNHLDTDSDGDGIDDRFEGTSDVDGDGVPDFIDNRDQDTDGDGLSDQIEGMVDTDGDGTPDSRDLDSDNDGISDADEAAYNGAIPADRDADSVFDYIDIDTDNDGIPDQLEGSGDRDNDGVADYRDLDSDNDGIFDLVEARLGQSDVLRLDSNNDGTIDPTRFVYGPNGLADTVETAAESGRINYRLSNVDGDSRLDFRDHDSDNDGILDTVESIHPDIDLNGLIDDVLSNDPSFLFNDASVDETGLSAEAGRLPVNSDSDELADFRDSDSDNDGLTDAAESVGPESDSDGDGRVDDFVDSDGDGVHDAIASLIEEPIDTDSDGIADHLDIDSDQDGINDLLESGGVDADGDGTVDNFTDLDFNGYDDALSLDPLTERDTDVDGNPDHRDLDSDGDGIFDIAASGNPDRDNDGIVDAAIDTDRDGILDSVDVDITGGADADGDGIDDVADADFNQEDDTDNDGIIDSLDADADGDGFVDSNPAVAAAGGGIVRTGLAGSGCVLGGQGATTDPLLGLLLLLSLLQLARRSVRRSPGS